MNSKLMRYSFFIISLLLWLFGLICLRFSGELGRNFWCQLIGYSSSFLGMILLYYSLLSFKKIVWILFLLTLVSRVLFIGYPVSDDFYRYAWEGRMQEQGVNPYLVSPNDISLTQYRDTLWNKINHKDFTAIYPPLSLIIFRAFSFAYPSPEFLRWFFILLDILSVFLLWKTLLHLRWKTSSIIFYALNPSVLIFFIGQIHLDILQVHFLIWVLFLYFKKRLNFMFLFLGFGVMIKYWLILLFPILFNRKNWYKSLFFFLPFLLWFVFYEPNQNLFESLKQFSSLNFNSFFYELVFPLANQYTVLVGIVLAIFFAMIILLIEPRIERNILFVFLLFIFVSPTIHPWYFLLPLPLLVFVPYWPLLILNLSCFIGLLPLYQKNIEQGVWEEFSWSVYVIWIPFLVAVLIKLFQRRQCYALKSSYPFVQKITVIIPSYNEENIIKDQILSLQDELKDIKHNLLVVDGGSTDKTLEILEEMGIWYIRSQKGRGFQIHAGLQKAVGDVCVIVHVDCKVSKQIFQDIITTMNRFPDSIGGAHQMIFEYDLEFPKWKLKLIEFLNRFRSKFLDIAFGDQVQFVRTVFARQIPCRMFLMEDVFLSLEIKKEGLYLSQSKKIRVSARKWKKRNFYFSIWIIILLVFKFLILYRLKMFNNQSLYFLKKYSD